MNLIDQFFKAVNFSTALPLVAIPNNLPNSQEFNEKLLHVIDTHHEVDKENQSDILKMLDQNFSNPNDKF